MSAARSPLLICRARRSVGACASQYAFATSFPSSSAGGVSNSGSSSGGSGGSSLLIRRLPGFPSRSFCAVGFGFRPRTIGLFVEAVALAVDPLLGRVRHDDIMIGVPHDQAAVVHVNRSADEVRAWFDALRDDEMKLVGLDERLVVRHR